MTNLIKVDLKRVLKDKLIIVILILGAVFALITPLLYRLLFSAVDDPSIEVIAGDLTSAKNHFFTAFSLSSDFGLIVPVLLAIILCKDFSFGTVRNKIICGNSRRSIFLSMYTVCAAVLWVVVLMHALLMLAISLCFFNFQQAPFTMSDFWYIIESLAFEFLAYMFVSALICWLCASMKNVGLVIVLYIAGTMGISIITSILDVATQLLNEFGGNKALIEILTFIQKINVFNYPAVIASSTSYSLKDALYFIIPPVVMGAGLIGLGIRSFNKKDIK